MDLTITKLAVYLSIFVIVSCSQAEQHVPLQHQGEQKQFSEDNNFIAYLSSQKLPANLSFCNEVVPIDVSEVKERAEREFLLNLQQPAQLLLNLKRSGRYFGIISTILKENNVPDDMKYLVVAESALYQARSTKDAVGLWQFIEPTAKRYGLRVDEFVDERKHVIKSTRAAIQYLKDAYARLGSWSLAAAGYNMGTDGVIDNVEFQGQKSYYDLYLNEETSRYLLRIAIIKELMSNASKYGIDVSTVEYYSPVSTKFIRVETPIDNLTTWAKENGNTYKDIKILNPWILKRSLPKPSKGSTWEVIVPN